MKRTSLALFLAAGLMLAPGATAQTVKPQDRNAALQYATVFYTADAELFSKTSDVDMTEVSFDKAKLPEGFKAAAELIRTRGEGPVGQLMEASRLHKCDFELAIEKGINVLMPHLGKMRAGVRLLRLDARRHLLDGDAAGAAERLAAIIRISQHAKGDDVLISSLVAAAMANTVAEETEEELESGMLTPEARQIIVAAFKAIPPSDPFATKAAIRGEQRIFLGWARNAFHGPTAGKQLADVCLIGNEGAPGPQEQGAAKSISAMNEDQVHAAVDLLAPYYDLVVAAWDKPDGTAQLEKLGARVTGGEYGPMGQVFAPAVSRARDKDFQIQKRVASVVQKLESK